MTAGPIEVMVVEDGASSHQGLDVLLEGTEGFSSLGSYRAYTRFLEELPGKKPDVVVMTLETSEGIADDVIRRALAVAPDLVILVLTRHDETELVLRCLSAGAQGYLTKPMSPATILEAIRNAYDGGSPMSSGIARKVVSFIRDGRARPAVTSRTAALTRREKDVLASLAAGKSYKEIARASRLSVNTVRYHIRNLYDKLEVHSQSEAVAKGLRQGLI